jgi:acyl-CoA synthetase (AMP-forming)/AMP-acid ligase II
MTGSWRSASGVVIRDHVPEALRDWWVRAGFCPGRDLFSLFAEQVRAHPEREAVIDDQGVLNYTELDTVARRAAAALVDAGLGPRDIVGIRLANGRDAVIAELAVLAIGAVALPLPDGGRATARLLDRARAGMVITAEPGGIRSCATLTSGDLHGPDGFRPAPIDSRGPARIMVSSGSEHEPRMVAYSHDAIGGGRASYVRALNGGAGPMRNLVLVPLSSSYGSCGVPVTIAALGGTLVLASSFDPDDALRMMVEHRPTHVFGVPTMLHRMARRPPRPGEDLSGLRAIVSSADALPEATAQLCRARFGRPVITVYGSSDGVNCHTAVSGIGTGKPDPAVVAIRIRAEDGGDCPPGVPGEICALGPMTPMSYVNAPELDARCRLPSGEVRTGDRGLLDEHGNLHVVGRLKQIVIRGGHNISPAEVERAVSAHPLVAEVVCVPVPDDELGERLCACVVQEPRTQPLTVAALARFLEFEHGLARRTLPERLLLLPELPLGATGKVCRRTLTELAARTHNAGPP